jgi:hypothetical protein
LSIPSTLVTLPALFEFSFSRVDKRVEFTVAGTAIKRAQEILLAFRRQFFEKNGVNFQRLLSKAGNIANRRSDR